MIIIFHFLNASFCSTHSAFNSYIFVTGRNGSDQKASDSINNSAVRSPHVCRQKSENPTCFLLSISIAITFSLKQHKESNARIFSLFQLAISALLVSQLDLNVIWEILSMISKFLVRNIFFLLNH